MIYSIKRKDQNGITKYLKPLGLIRIKTMYISDSAYK